MDNTHLFNRIIEESGVHVDPLQSLTIEELLHGFSKLMIDIDYLYDKLQLDKLFRCIQSVYHNGSKKRVEKVSNSLNVDLFHKIKESLDDSNEEKKNASGILNQRTKLKEMLKNLHDVLEKYWSVYNLDDKELMKTLKEVHERFEPYTNRSEERGGSVFTRTGDELFVLPMLSSMQYNLNKKEKNIDPFTRPSNELSSSIKEVMSKLHETIKPMIQKAYLEGIDLIENHEMLFLQQNQELINYRMKATTYLFMFQHIFNSLVNCLFNSISDMITNLKQISSGSSKLTPDIGIIVLVGEIMTSSNDRVDLKNPITHKLRNIVSDLLQKTKLTSINMRSRKTQISDIATERGLDKPRYNIEYTQAIMPIEIEGERSGTSESSISSGSLDDDFLKRVITDLDEGINVNDVMDDVKQSGIRVVGKQRRINPKKKITLNREPIADDKVPGLSNTYGIQRIRPIEPHMDLPHLRTYVEIDGPNDQILDGYIIGEDQGKYIIGLSGYKVKVSLFDVYKLFESVGVSNGVDIQEDLLEFMDIRDDDLQENSELTERLMNNIRRITRGKKLLVTRSATSILSNMDRDSKEVFSWKNPLEAEYLEHIDGDYYLLATVFDSINTRNLPYYFMKGYPHKLEDIKILITYDDKIIKLNRGDFRVGQGDHMDMVARQLNQDRDEDADRLYDTFNQVLGEEDRLTRNTIRDVNTNRELSANLDGTMGQLRGLQFESQVPEYVRQRAFETSDGFIGGSKVTDCCDKNIKTRKKCRRRDNKVFKLPRKYSRKKCFSKKKKGFSMKSSCAPFKYCEKDSQIGGGSLFSRDRNKVNDYKSSDWSEPSDSISPHYLDPYGSDGLYGDSGIYGAQQWFDGFGSQFKDSFRIYEGEQEVCKLPHKGNSKRLKNWMKSRNIKKTNSSNDLTEKEIYGKVTRKDDLFEHMECKNETMSLDIVCKDGVLTETKCVKNKAKPKTVVEPKGMEGNFDQIIKSQEELLNIDGRNLSIQALADLRYTNLKKIQLKEQNERSSGGGKIKKKPIKTQKKGIKHYKKNKGKHKKKQILSSWKPEEILVRPDPQEKLMSDSEIVRMGVKDMDDYTHKTKGKQPDWGPKKDTMLFDFENMKINEEKKNELEDLEKELKQMGL